MYLIGTFGMIAAALFGRWIQLNPGKVVTQGTFEGPNTSGAIHFRQLIAVQGTLFVFFGTLYAIFSLSYWFHSTSIAVMAFLCGGTAGVFAARYVRKEVRAQGDPAPGQFGLWP